MVPVGLLAGDGLTYGASGLPAGLSLDLSTGLISGTLPYTSAGTHAVTATVSDGELTSTQTFTWTVTNVNRAPVLTTVLDQSQAENATVSLALVASDLDGDPLTYGATGLPAGLGIDTADIGLPGAGPHVVKDVERLAQETAMFTGGWRIRADL